MEYNTKKNHKLSLLKEKLFFHKNKSISPEKTEVTFNIVNNVDIGRLLNMNKQYTDKNKDDLKKIYKLSRNENKIKFLSYDFHQNSNLNNNNKNLCNNYENSFGFSTYNNSNVANKNKDNSNMIIHKEKPKPTFYGFDKTMSKYSARITNESTANYSNDNSNNITNFEKTRNKKQSGKSGIVYSFDKEADVNIKFINDSRPFNLSYMKLSKFNTSQNKTKNLLEDKFPQIDINKEKNSNIET